MSTQHSVQFAVGDARVAGILDRPPEPRALLVLAHGAGAGMLHPFLNAMAARLAEREVATFRYQFPYMDARRRRPDPPETIVAGVRAAVNQARALVPGLPLFAGGKSFGGRMTSTAQGGEPLPGVRGLVFLGFPLHPPGRPGTSRADHLDGVAVPMLFLQGTRDDFAGVDELQPVMRRLGPRATLHVVDGADHSFHVLKRSGRTDAKVLHELADAIASWMTPLLVRD
jgi:predicted alpha/beta-hydrolase family hydrolase